MTTGPSSFDPNQPHQQQPEQPMTPGGTQPPQYSMPGYSPQGQPMAPPPTGGYGSQAQPMRPDEEKLWAIGAHLGPLLLGFIAPLVVWLVFRERSAFLDRHAKEALNFQISLLIYVFASFALMLVLIGFLLIFVVGIAALVLMVMATVKAANFEDFRYPATIRFVK